MDVRPLIRRRRDPQRRLVFIDTPVFDLDGHAGTGGPVIADDLGPGCVGAFIGRGQRPQLDRLRSGIHFAIEEIRIILADVADEILARTSVPLPRVYSPAQARDALAPAIKAICAGPGLTPDALLGAGLAVSSPVTPVGEVLRNSVLPTWSAVHLGDYFTPILPCPIHAENESNCAALAEMMWGAAQGERDFILYKLDLGIGGSIVRNGQVWRGMHGSAGEFGFISRHPMFGIEVATADGTVGSVVGGLALLARANRPGLTLERLIAGALAGSARFSRPRRNPDTVKGRCAAPVARSTASGGSIWANVNGWTEPV